MRPTPIDSLFILVGILPTELCRKQAMLSLACRAQGPKHILNERFLSPPYKGYRQLKLRHAFVPVALELLKDILSRTTAWHVGRQPNEIRNGKVTPPAYVLSSLKATPSHWKCIYPDYPGSGLIASALALIYSILKSTDGVWTPQQPVRVARRANH